MLGRTLVFFLVASACACTPALTGDPDAAASDTGAPDATATDVSRVLGDGDLPGCTPSFGAVETQGPISDVRLAEVSGMVASRRDPGVRYVHNDSGETVTRFFAVLADGSTLAEIVIDGLPPPRDWEDVAIETTGDGREVLTFGDVGDNAARDGSGTPRASVSVVRVEPPTLPVAPSAVALHVSALGVTTLVYPDAPHDCEAIFVAPETGDLYLVTKENAGPAGLYRATAPLVDGETRTLERVADVFARDSLITGADASERFIVVRNYGRAWIFDRRSASVAETLAGVGVRLPAVTEPQGEAIALEPGGVLLASEGVGEPVHFVPFTCAP